MNVIGSKGKKSTFPGDKACPMARGRKVSFPDGKA